MSKSNIARKRDFHARQNEIAPIPRVKNQKRKNRCRKNLALFLRTYFPHIFYRKFSKDQLDIIDALQTAIIETGRDARALPRGGGKTSIGVGAVIFALVYGYRRFPVVIGPSEDHGKQIIKNIKHEAETNDLLLADFPKIFYPIRCLEGKHARARSQHHKGLLTNIVWKTNELQLPRVKGSKVGGAILKAAGITASLRGMNESGTRPDFVLLDDPQTRESAKSPTQTTDREETILGDIMGLAGHDKIISAYMTCTVIYKGDLADRFLDHERHPDWHGVRSQLVYKWPPSKLWDEYDEIWRECHQDGDRLFERATAFYRRNRKAMDRGGVVSDEELYDKKRELSALQHARNLLLQLGRAAFDAEYQNNPPDRELTLYDLTVDIVMKRFNNLPKHKLDSDVKIVTAFSDINFSGLHWAMVGWRNDRTGFILDYGKVPERGVLVEPNSNDTEQKQQIAAGLNSWLETLSRFDLPVPIKIAGIDRGFHPEVVHQVSRYARYPFPVAPCKGYGAGQYRPRASSLVGKPGFECHFTKSQFGQFFAANSDYWREATQRGFLSPPGTPGSMSLYGRDGSRHQRIAEHICAEKLVDKAEGKNGALFWKWAKRPSEDNDWLDAVVGCMALASWYLGEVDAQPSRVGGRPRKKKYVEKRKAKVSHI